MREACPCGSGAPFAACCEPLIRGDRPAPSAEALMRSRYSAYATQAIDYIVSTHAPETRDEVDREATEKWSREAEWLGLEVVSSEEQGDDGRVEFRARYRIAGGAETVHHERSRFRRTDDTWYFVDGDQVKPRPVVREAAKVGRNDPCPCGSGKKYKKCHGA